MENWITLLATFLGLVAASLTVWSEMARRRNLENDKNKVIVQVVYPPNAAPTPPPSKQENTTPQQTITPETSSNKEISQPQESQNKQVFVENEIPTKKDVSKKKDTDSNFAKITIQKVDQAIPITKKEVETIAQKTDEMPYRDKTAVVIGKKKYDPSNLLSDAVKSKGIELDANKIKDDEAIEVFRNLNLNIQHTSSTKTSPEQSEVPKKKLDKLAISSVFSVTPQENKKENKINIPSVFTTSSPSDNHKEERINIPKAFEPIPSESNGLQKKSDKMSISGAFLINKISEPKVSEDAENKICDKKAEPKQQEPAQMLGGAFQATNISKLEEVKDISKLEEVKKTGEPNAPLSDFNEKTSSQKTPKISDAFFIKPK